MKAIKKIVKTIGAILVGCILFINIYNFIQIRVLHKDVGTINGYAFLEVISGSMEPTIKVGDLVVINTNDKDIKENDVITYASPNGSLVTHRVTESSSNGFITKGDANNTVDEKIVNKNNIVGKYTFRIPYFGIVLNAFQKPLTLILILIIGIIICILKSTDENGIPNDLSEEEKEFIKYKRNSKLKVGD